MDINLISPLIFRALLSLRLTQNELLRGRISLRRKQRLSRLRRQLVELRDLVVVAEAV
jgi:hypothetical protein